MLNRVELQDLGLIRYKDAWDYQTELLDGMRQRKLENRKAEEKKKRRQRHYFLLCEHPHVFTLGKSGSEDHLLLDAERREKEEVEYFKINRGGDITYHGPGQVVGYPILDLDHFFTDVHKYVRLLEETIILTLKDFGIEGMRIADYTGVWLDKEGHYEKICAIGVHLSRWITMHGFALNVNTNLDYFNFIVPCGIDENDKGITSISKELEGKQDVEKVKERIVFHFQNLFNCKVNI